MPGLDARLRADPPALIADVGGGDGALAIALASAYPTVTAYSWDPDDAAIAKARRAAAEAGVDGRVRFEVRDLTDPRIGDTHELVLGLRAFRQADEAPSVLKLMRAIVGPQGFVIVGHDDAALLRRLATEAGFAATERLETPAEPALFRVR